jgi:hypothetical protein
MELDGVLVISEPGSRQKTRGEFGPFITENATVFRQHFGVVLFPGSLNVYVAQPPSLQKDLDTGKLPPAFVVPRGELSGNPNYVGDGQAWRCTLHSDKIPSPVNCWIFRRINSRVSPGVIEPCCGSVASEDLSLARRGSCRHSPRGQVRTLLDNFDGDALEIGRTAGRVRSAWARSSSSRIARN